MWIWAVIPVFMTSTKSLHVLCISAKLLQSCPTLCNPIICIPLVSSAHGVLQARILEWVAMPSSRGSSRPTDQTHVSYVSCIGRQVLLLLALPGICHITKPTDPILVAE